MSMKFQFLINLKMAKIMVNRGLDHIIQLFMLLINVKILNFGFSRIEHEKSIVTSEPGARCSKLC